MCRSCKLEQAMILFGVSQQGGIDSGWEGRMRVLKNIRPIRPYRHCVVDKKIKRLVYCVKYCRPIGRWF